MSTEANMHTDELLTSIRVLLQQNRTQLQQAVNSAMVQTYWQIGQLIIEYEQKGQQRADYGKGQLKQLSKALTAEFGKGFDVTNLRNMRQFFMLFGKRDSVRRELSWTHYRRLIRVENEQARQWYLR